MLIHLFYYEPSIRHLRVEISVTETELSRSVSFPSRRAGETEPRAVVLGKELTFTWSPTLPVCSKSFTLFLYLRSLCEHYVLIGILLRGLLCLMAAQARYRD